MASRSKGMKAKDYKSVGTTSDGVRVLKPILKPKSFTTAQIRATIRKVLREQQDGQATADRERSSRSA